jgi:Carboxypeptidase regulatory-like domain
VPHHSPRLVSVRLRFRDYCPPNLPLPLFRVLALLCLTFLPTLARQTTNSGGLTGIVTDQSGAVIPEAAVELLDNAKGTLASARTNADGLYLFSFLQPSRYTFTVAHPGFQTFSCPLTVSLGPPSTLNVQLKIATSTFSITATDEAPLLNAENGDASTTINQQQVSQLPNPGNDLTYIAQIAPGTIMNTEGGFGNFSMLGMPGTSTLFTVNGMDDNDVGVNVNFSGAMNMLLGQNQVQEATVVANGYSGQFGGAAGANVNYITKSGGNLFHGNAQYFWNGRVLNANNWFNNAFSDPRPFTIANQWAGSFGGPIKKDKLFFFFNTEGIRALLPFPFGVVLPSSQFEAATIANIDQIFGPVSASDKFYKQIFNLYNATPGAGGATPGSFGDPLGCGGFVGPNGLGTTVPCSVHFLKTIGEPTYESIQSGRVDWNIAPTDRAFLLVQYDHGRQASYIDPISPLFNIISNQPWWQGQLSETHSFGPSMVNQLLLSATYFSELFGPVNSAQTLAAFPTDLLWLSGPFTTLGGEDDEFGVPNGKKTTQSQVSDDFVKVRGAHKLSFGVKFVRTDLTSYAFSLNVNGYLVPTSVDAFYQGGVDPASPGVNFTSLVQAFPADNSERFKFYTLAFYAQDEWRVRANLTFTFALRAEHQSNPVCPNDCFARPSGPFDSLSHDPDQPYNQAIVTGLSQAFIATQALYWQPRLSFAWQPLGVSRNVVLRGGVGIFYNPLPGQLGGSFAFNPPVVNSFNVSGYSMAPDETNSLFKVAAASNAAFLNGFNSGQNLAGIQAADPFFFPPALSVANNKTMAPQYQKWSLELQRTFHTSTSLSVGYFGNHGIHELVSNLNANAYGFGDFPAALCSSPPVPPCADPRFSDVTQITTEGVSNYNGMVVSLKQRFTRWGLGLFQANYTYGHALDEVSNGGLSLGTQFTSGSFFTPQDPYNLRGSYGSADYDVRHSFNANYLWQLPIKEILRGHGSDYLLKGWQLSGTIFARTGLPYTVQDFQEGSILGPDNFQGVIYAVPAGPLLAGSSCGEGAAIPSSPHPCLPPQVLADGVTPNPGALFVQATCETGFNSGNLPGPSGPCSGPAVSFAQGRNRFRGPGYFNTDLALLKNTKIPRWENAVFGIGFNFFNLFNHPNFGLPYSDISDPAYFGRVYYLAQPPTSILGSGLAPNGDVSPRMIQVRAQLQF